MLKKFIVIPVVALFVFAVVPIVQADSQPFQFITTQLTAASTYQPYTATINFVYGGSSAPTATATGLPPGLKLNVPVQTLTSYYSVVLSGTPTQGGNFTAVIILSSSSSNEAQAQNFPIAVQNNNGMNGAAFSISANAASSPLYPATVGRSYNCTIGFDYTGSSTPQVTFVNLPLGINAGAVQNVSYQSNMGAVYNYSVQLAGTPQAAGTYQVGINLTDGQYINQYTLPLVVSPDQTASQTPTSTAGTTGGSSNSSFNMPVASPSVTSAHSAGSLINEKGTIYVVTEYGLLGIPSMSVFNSWGFSLSQAQTASSADYTLPEIGVLAGRKTGEANLFNNK